MERILIKINEKRVNGRKQIILSDIITAKKFFDYSNGNKNINNKNNINEKQIDYKDTDIKKNCLQI